MDLPIIRAHEQSISPGITVNVFFVRGRSRCALIDTGVKPHRQALVDFLYRAGANATGVDYLLITHAHCDHVGSNQCMVEQYHPTVLAHKLAKPWLEDLELHYTEFAAFAPDILPDTLPQRQRIMGYMDGPVQMDLAIDEGVEIYLGGETVLQTFRVPGHKSDELCWFERSTRTLILADALICTDLPFFHGYTDVAALINTLQRLPTLAASLRVERVLPAHLPPMDRFELGRKVSLALSHVQQVEQTCVESVSENPSMKLKDAFVLVSKRMNRLADYHALATVKAHFEYLVNRGVFHERDGGFWLA